MSLAPPTGRFARENWKALPKSTRTRLLRSREPHPDPVVGLIAVGYAQEHLAPGRVWRLGLSRLGLSAAIVLLYTVTMFALESDLLWRLRGFAVILALTLPMIHGGRQAMRLLRMANINTPYAPVRPAQTYRPDAPGPVSYQVSGGELLRYNALFVGPALVALLCLGLYFQNWPPIIASFVVYGVWLLGYALRWVRPGRPVLRLTPEGVTSQHGITLPWSQITEIRVLPMRGSRRTDQVIVFVPADPAAALSQLTGWFAFCARLNDRYYQSPIVLGDALISPRAQDIAVRAASYAGTPLRWSPS